MNLDTLFIIFGKTAVTMLLIVCVNNQMDVQTHWWVTTPVVFLVHTFFYPIRKTSSTKNSAPVIPTPRMPED